MVLIAHISDMHVRPRGHPASRIVETNMLLHRTIDRILTLDPRPDAVIATGDLVDEGLESEYEMLRELLDRLPMPCYPVLGNHDARDTFRAVFGGASWLPDTGRIRYAVDVGDIRLIALDSHVPGKAHGLVEREDLDWLDRELAATAHPSFVVLHHPPLVCGIASMDAIGLRNSAELGEVIAGHDNVLRVLAGHVHRPITTAFAGSILMVAPSTAHQVTLDLTGAGASSFVFEPPAFYLHHLADDCGLVSHMVYVESFEGPFPFWPDPRHRWTLPETA